MICNICHKKIDKEKPYVRVTEYYHKFCYLNKMSVEQTKRMAGFLKFGLDQAEMRAKKIIKEER